jgi:hypothetical protein
VLIRKSILFKLRFSDSNEDVFDKRKMLDLMNTLEEENLFLVNQLQEKEFLYQDISRQQKQLIKSTEEEIRKKYIFKNDDNQRSL